MQFAQTKKWGNPLKSLIICLLLSASLCKENLANMSLLDVDKEISITDASDEVNTKKKMGPPVTGKHFYANFRKGYETGVFYIDILVHDTKLELDLWVTSAEPNMGLISQEGPNNQFFVKKRYSKLQSRMAVSDPKLTN